MVPQLMTILDNGEPNFQMVCRDRNRLAMQSDILGASAHGIKYSNTTELVESSEIAKLIDENIDSMQKDLANFERVRRFSLLEKAFTIEDGELTPSLKVRRKVVEEKYAHLIQGMYEGVN